MDKIDDLIQALVAIEEEISLLAEADEIDDARINELSAQRLDYIKRITFMQLDEEEENKRQEFARAFASHALRQIEDLKERRSETRAELVKMRQGNAGLQAYGKVGRP